MILTDDLVEGLRTVTPIEGQWRLWEIVIGDAVRIFHDELLNPLDDVGGILFILASLKTVRLLRGLGTVQQSRIVRIRKKVIVRGRLVGRHDRTRRLLVAEKIRTALFKAPRLDDLALHARLRHPLIHEENPS
ncbi:hypothetical protein KB1_02120 [Cutibacterium modestum]|uniref:Uncharacterized protein n=1 Tax=Cutibacterium modestum TaxID=2559073 RepID=A0AAD1KM93_9ACTN|nr:hypothetical protein KB1_02120 [Cutibacterium modestum]